MRLDDLGPRAVAGAVVDEQDLGLDAHAVEGPRQPFDQDGEDLVLVEDRHDDRQGRPAGRGPEVRAGRGVGRVRAHRDEPPCHGR
ncbi:MAG TPA: hypothetical protein VGH33_11620, partial [Isosphaeraceae bacterium]